MSYIRFSLIQQSTGMVLTRTTFPVYDIFDVALASEVDFVVDLNIFRFVYLSSALGRTDRYIFDATALDFSQYDGFCIAPGLVDTVIISPSLSLRISDIVFLELNGSPIPFFISLDFVILVDYDNFRIMKRSLFDQYISCPLVAVPPVISAPSLNGNGSEYIDGTAVNVDMRDLVYTVVRSYMTLYSDNSYTAHYDLVSENGAKLSAPEALLTQYIAPIIAP